MEGSPKPAQSHTNSRAATFVKLSTEGKKKSFYGVPTNIRRCGATEDSLENVNILKVRWA